MRHALRRFAVMMFAVALSGSMASAAGTKMTIGAGVDPGFAEFYIAKRGGIFEKNGLDVLMNTGPSGSAMVSFLINNQSQAVIAAEQAGIQNFNLDRDVVVVAEATEVKNYWGVVARDIETLDGLKGKRVGVSAGSGSEVFWLTLIDRLHLNPKDYRVVNVEPPEMIAALENRNIDAFVSWEPWMTKAVQAIPNTRIVRDNDGIMTPRAYLYMNKSWLKSNPAAAQAFMRSIIEASELTRTDPKQAATYVAQTLRLDVPLAETLMRKLIFDVRITQPSVDHLVEIAEQIAQTGKLKKAVDWAEYIYPDLLRSVAPDKVDFTYPK